MNPQDRKQLNCLAVFFFSVNLLFDARFRFVQYSYLLRRERVVDQIKGSSFITKKAIK